MAHIKQWLCGLVGHNWTCLAQQGIDPNPEQLKTVNGFYDYAKMYCARCDYESALNKR